MKKIKALLMSSLLTGSAFANVSSTATMTSDYVFRGITQSTHDSAIQGSMDYEKGNYTVGVWTSSNSLKNSDSALIGQEVDLYIGYSFEINKENSIQLQYVDYTYTRDANSNFQEAIVTYSGPWVDIVFGTTQNYGGDDDNGASTYVGVSKSFEIEPNVSLSLSYGSTSFAEEKKIGTSGYSDYKIGISKQKGDWTAELFHTNALGYSEYNSSTDKFDKDEQLSVVGFSLSTTL